jgi:hypothetical protein
MGGQTCFLGSLLSEHFIWNKKTVLQIVSKLTGEHIQGDSGGICTTLGDDSMSDSKQKSSYEHGSDF